MNNTKVTELLEKLRQVVAESEGIAEYADTDKIEEICYELSIARKYESEFKPKGSK